MGRGGADDGRICAFDIYKPTSINPRHRHRRQAFSTAKRDSIVPNSIFLNSIVLNSIVLNPPYLSIAFHAPRPTGFWQSLALPAPLSWQPVLRIKRFRWSSPVRCGVVGSTAAGSSTSHCAPARISILDSPLDSSSPFRRRFNSPDTQLNSLRSFNPLPTQDPSFH